MLWSVAKIADLGVAKNDSQCTRARLTRAPGMPEFMPPEALQNVPVYDTSLDVFSYGGIMLHTINEEWPTPKFPTSYDPTTQQTKGLSEVECRQEHLDKITEEADVLRPLIESCLNNDPVRRPSMVHVSEMIRPLKVCIYMCTCICVCIYVRMYVYVCVCLHVVCSYVCLYICSSYVMMSLFCGCQ